MSRGAQARLKDIQEALEAIREYVGGSLTDPFVDELMVLDAVLFRLLVIGEAVKNVDDELRAAAPEVPWEQLRRVARCHRAPVFPCAEADH